MSAFQQFKEAVHLPAGLGAELPYVRLFVINDERDAGADADVEFEDSGNDGESVAVTISGWRRDDRGQVIRGETERFVFGLPTGNLQLVQDVDALEALAGLLAAVSGMRPMPEAADPA